MDEQEKKKIVGLVIKATATAVKSLKDKGLVSAYIGGTILTEDCLKHSDINIFGLVTEKFNLDTAQSLNDLFRKERYKQFDGREVKFWAIPISAVEGGKQFGIIKLLKPERFIRKIPFFKHVWGRKYDFQKEFRLKQMPLKEEALFLIGRIKDDMRDLRKDRETFHYTEFPKLVMELVRVEAEKEKGFKFDPSYTALSKHMEKEEHHIIHKAMHLRKINPTRQEVVGFCSDVEEYINDLLKRMKDWK